MAQRALTTISSPRHDSNQRGRSQHRQKLESGDATPFPSEEQLRRPETWGEILVAVRVSKEAAEKQGHLSLRREVVMTYGLGRFFTRHKSLFEKFCLLNEIKLGKKVITDDLIMHEVFKEYAGRTPKGKKEANKLKNLIMPSLAKGLSAIELDDAIYAMGGVHNLRKDETPPRRNTVRKSKTALPYEVTSSQKLVAQVTRDQEVAIKLKHPNRGRRSMSYSITIIATPAPNYHFEPPRVADDNEEFLESVIEYLESKADAKEEL